MWALKLLGDDLRSPHVDKCTRRQRHHDGVRQLPRYLRDDDTDPQPYIFFETRIIRDD